MTALPSWSDVLASALVGTERRPLAAPPAGGDPAGALLDVAAVLSLRRRAGLVPPRGVPAPEPAPAEGAPTASAAAGARLARLLDPAGDRLDAETRAQLLTEWLTVAARRGLRVPGELLPALLDAGRRQRELRPLVAAAGGARAAWLAAQRGEWAYLAAASGGPAEADHRDWELGGSAQRVAYLAALRATDPGTARRLLAAAWPGEAPDDRVALLATVQVGLSLDDEELLERALDDRRKEVRALAADLLGRLPGSAYQGRMAVRARACVRRERRGLRGDRLAVTPPAECDGGMRRDGVAARPPQGVGERAWWLEELLARTPLTAWAGGEGSLAASPREFLALRVPEGWGPVLLRGLARSAASSRDPRWSGPLLDALFARAAPAQRPDDALLAELLYAGLPPDELVDRAVAGLQRAAARAPAPGIDRLLELCPRPWPPRLSAAVLEALSALARRSVPSWRVADLCRLAATRLPVDAAEPLGGEGWPGAGDGPVRRAVEALVDVLRFRYEMLEELA
jgi:uncharacterized protein DUF5691